MKKEQGQKKSLYGFKRLLFFNRGLWLDDIYVALRLFSFLFFSFSWLSEIDNIGVSIKSDLSSVHMSGQAAIDVIWEESKS